MDQSLDEWFAEYRRLSNALGAYLDRISSKTHSPKTPRELTEPQRVLEDLHYYWSASLVNNGDVFGYVPFIIEHKDDFVAIGAVGTLRALDELMPFYLQQQKLQSDIEQNEFRRHTKEERTHAEALAEDVHEFARLLLAYAQANDTQPDILHG